MFGKWYLLPYLVVPLISASVPLISTRVSAHCQAILLLGVGTVNCDVTLTSWYPKPRAIRMFVWQIVQVNTLRPRQNGRHFADDTFNRIFVNENVRISIEFSLKFVPKGPINNIPALVQIMAWRRLGDKPLSEPVMVSLLTHICVTRPQCVNSKWNIKNPH